MTPSNCDRGLVCRFIVRPRQRQGHVLTHRLLWIHKLGQMPIWAVKKITAFLADFSHFGHFFDKKNAHYHRENDFWKTQKNVILMGFLVICDRSNWHLPEFVYSYSDLLFTPSKCRFSVHAQTRHPGSLWIHKRKCGAFHRWRASHGCRTTWWFIVDECSELESCCRNFAASMKGQTWTMCAKTRPYKNHAQTRCCWWSDAETR